MIVNIDGHLYENNTKVPMDIVFDTPDDLTDPEYTGTATESDDSSMSIVNGKHSIHLVLEPGPVGPTGPTLAYTSDYRFNELNPSGGYSIVSVNSVSSLHSFGVYAFSDWWKDNIYGNLILETDPTDDIVRPKRSISPTGGATGNVLSDIGRDMLDPDDENCEEALDYLYTLTTVLDGISTTGSGNAITDIAVDQNDSSELVATLGGSSLHSSITAADFVHATGYTPRQINTYTNKIYEYYLDGNWVRTVYNTSATATGNAYSPPTAKGLCFLTNMSKYYDYSMVIQ